MKTYLRPAVSLFILLTLITGGIYPLLVTAFGSTFFSAQAHGSLLTDHGQIIGSKLIGQTFSAPDHFWSRPSATSPMTYNPSASGGSNLSPTNPALIDAIKARVDALHAADPDNKSPIPVDLVTASASGLDPEESIAAAEYQAPRVARVRQLSLTDVNYLIERHTSQRFLGIFGERRVNVLELNLALDTLAKAK